MPSVAVLRYMKIQHNADFSVLFAIIIICIFLGEKQEISVFLFVIIVCFLIKARKAAEFHTFIPFIRCLKSAEISNLFN